MSRAEPRTGTRRASVEDLTEFLKLRVQRAIDMGLGEQAEVECAIALLDAFAGDPDDEDCDTDAQCDDEGWDVWEKRQPFRHASQADEPTELVKVAFSRL